MDSRRFYVLTLVQIVGVSAFFWFIFTTPAVWNLERYIGTALVIIGVSFIAVARYQLGRSFSVKPEAHALVTTGLYAKIRNPIYVFGMVMLTGAVLVFQRPGLWMLLVVAAVAQTVRARREAKVLEAAFGDAYREYRRKTWF